MRGKTWATLLIIVVFGCSTTTDRRVAKNNMPKIPVGEHLYQSLKVEYPVTGISVSDQKFDTGPLNNFNFSNPENFFRITLDQCIENALRDSRVVRDLGGTVLRSPELALTEDDPALAYTNPVTGEEAALSAFDASLSNQFLYQDNDRAFNSSFIGDQGLLVQDTATYLSTLSKRSATGGLFQLSHQVLYDRNNTPANRFADDTSYDTFLQAEIRQPLLQGAGSVFNRIAGPGNPVGVNNGVLIARTNTDISLADFELGIRNLISDVENAYWDLYFAYRDLESKIEARNGAFRIWESLKGQEDDKRQVEVLQAEEQYYLFAARVEDAIYGQLNDGTRTNNGSLSGTFRGNSGVRTAERRLRLLGGFPVNDATLILPIDSPAEVAIVFDWNQVKSDALVQRVELRRQRWVLKREQLNHIANKKQVQPRLDLVSRYRVRGFGNDLFGDDGFNPNIAPGVDAQNGSDASATFLNGDLQEWELGVDLDIPIGYRRQRAAVRNSELRIMREKKILREQEREIIYGLSNALGELERTESLLQVNTKRLNASKNQYQAILEEWQQDNTTIDLVLESQRRVIEAKVDFFRTQVEFMLGVKSVHFEKGTGLQYHNVTLTENGWCQCDLKQAAEREKLKGQPLNYVCHGIKVSTPHIQPSIGFTDPSDSPQYFVDKTPGSKQTKVAANSKKPQRKTLSKDDKKLANTDKKSGSKNTNSVFSDSLLTKLAKKIETVQNDQKKSAETKKSLARSIKAKLVNTAQTDKTVANSKPTKQSKSQEPSILSKMVKKINTGQVGQNYAKRSESKQTNTDRQSPQSRKPAASSNLKTNKKKSQSVGGQKQPTTQTPRLKFKSVNEFLSSFRRNDRPKNQQRKPKSNAKPQSQGRSNKTIPSSKKSKPGSTPRIAYNHFSDAPVYVYPNNREQTPNPQRR